MRSATTGSARIWPAHPVVPPIPCPEAATLRRVPPPHGALASKLKIVAGGSGGMEEMIRGHGGKSNGAEPGIQASSQNLRADNLHPRALPQPLRDRSRRSWPASRSTMPARTSFSISPSKCCMPSEALSFMACNRFWLENSFRVHAPHSARMNLENLHHGDATGGVLTRNQPLRNDVAERPWPAGHGWRAVPARRTRL